MEFDRSKPDGRPCKQADVTKLRRKVPAFRPTVSLEQGLAEMIEWYERARRSGVFHDSPSALPSLASSRLPTPVPASALASAPNPAPSPA